MKGRFDSVYEDFMSRLDEEGEGAAPAGAMSDAGYVDASVNDPASPEAIYVFASGGSKKRLKKRKTKLMRRKIMHKNAK